MLQEMKLEDALKNFLQGREVQVMYNEVTDSENPVFSLEPLDKLFKGIRFLVEMPENEAGDRTKEKPQAVPRTMKEKKTPAPKGTGKLDIHAKEIMEKLENGASQGKIAKEYGVASGTVSYWIKNQKAKEGKLCQTCQYRERNPKMGNCDYIGITGHSRNCKADNCDKYVEGEPLKGKRAL